jgi:transcriptional regulator with XRE-family HTH domain
MHGVSDSASPVAREIYRRMRQANLTQKALATRAGVGSSYVRDLLRGKSLNPRYEHLSAIAKALGCSIEDLNIAPRPHDQIGQSELIDKPEEMAILRFFRSLSPAERRRFVVRTFAGLPEIMSETDDT